MLKLPSLLFCATLGLSAPLWAHGDLSLQIQHLEGELVLHPQDLETRFQLAQDYRFHEDWDKAAAAYAELVKQKPEEARAYYGQGCLAVDRGQPAAAEAPLKRLLALRPKDPKGLALLAEAYQRTGRAKEAQALFSQANAAEPRVELYLEQSQSFVADGRIARALQACEDGIRRLGPLVVLEKEALSQERSLGRSEAALRRLNKIVVGPGRKDPWLELKGDILAEAAKPAPARQAWQAALNALAQLPEQRRLTQAGQDEQARLEKKLRSGLVAELKP